MFPSNICVWRITSRVDRWVGTRWLGIRWLGTRWAATRRVGTRWTGCRRWRRRFTTVHCGSRLNWSTRAERTVCCSEWLRRDWSDRDCGDRNCGDRVCGDELRAERWTEFAIAVQIRITLHSHSVTREWRCSISRSLSIENHWQFADCVRSVNKPTQEAQLFKSDGDRWCRAECSWSAAVDRRQIHAQDRRFACDLLAIFVSALTAEPSSFRRKLLLLGKPVRANARGSQCVCVWRFGQTAAAKANGASEGISKRGVEKWIALKFWNTQLYSLVSYHRSEVRCLGLNRILQVSILIFVYPTLQAFAVLHHKSLIRSNRLRNSRIKITNFNLESRRWTRGFQVHWNLEKWERNLIGVSHC